MQDGAGTLPEAVQDIIKPAVDPLQSLSSSTKRSLPLNHNPPKLPSNQSKLPLSYLPLLYLIHIPLLLRHHVFSLHLPLRLRLLRRRRRRRLLRKERHSLLPRRKGALPTTSRLQLPQAQWLDTLLEK